MLNWILNLFKTKCETCGEVATHINYGYGGYNDCDTCYKEYWIDS